MDPNLIIDDDYVDDVGRDSTTRGNKLEGILDNFLTILNEMKAEAIVEGKIADALAAYISCVSLLNDQLTEISLSVERADRGFIQDVNTADEYLF